MVGHTTKRMTLAEAGLLPLTFFMPENEASWHCVSMKPVTVNIENNAHEMRRVLKILKISAIARSSAHNHRHDVAHLLARHARRGK